MEALAEAWVVGAPAAMMEVVGEAAVLAEEEAVVHLAA